MDHKDHMSAIALLPGADQLLQMLYAPLGGRVRKKGLPCLLQRDALYLRKMRPAACLQLKIKA